MKSGSGSGTERAPRPGMRLPGRQLGCLLAVVVLSGAGCGSKASTTPSPNDVDSGSDASVDGGGPSNEGGSTGSMSSGGSSGASSDSGTSGDAEAGATTPPFECPPTPSLRDQLCSQWNGTTCSYPPQTDGGACFTEVWFCGGGEWACTGNLCTPGPDCPFLPPKSGDSCQIHNGACVYAAPDGSSNIWTCTCHQGVQNCNEGPDICGGQDAGSQD